MISGLRRSLINGFFLTPCLAAEYNGKFGLSLYPDVEHVMTKLPPRGELDLNEDKASLLARRPR